MPLEKTWKQHLADLWDGREIYLVNGEYVRDHYFADFVEGGSHESYPEVIPADEIWVEKLQVPNDLVESLVHEVFESTLMRYDIEKDYDDSHDATNSLSTAIRKIRRANKVPAATLARLSLYPESGVEQAPKGEV
jgi:hypothetical protein